MPVDRPYAGGKVPPGLTATRPLLEFLDRARLSYDLTTDVALARRQGPSLSNAPGVAIAGTARWVPRQLRDGLRREVEDEGLGVVFFGDRSLRRTVAVVGGRLANPSPPRPDDLFGERTRAQRLDAPAPLNQQDDRLRVFRGTDRLFGDFSRLEVSTSLPEDAEPLSAAGREQEGRPAFVGYRFGKGTVIRPGTPQWVPQLARARSAWRCRGSRATSGACSGSVARVSRRMTRKLLAAGAVFLLLVAGAAAYKVLDKEDPPQKRGSATEEFDPTETVKKPTVPAKKVIAVPWPTFGYDIQRTKESPYDHAPPYKRTWRVDAKDTLEFPASAAYGNIYIAQQKGLFIAMRGKTGKRVFKTKDFKRCAASSPTIANGVIYQAYMDFVECGQSDPNPTGFVIAMDAKTGKQKWRYKGMPFESSPLLHDGILYVGSWDGRVHAIRAKTGRRIWTHDTGARVNTSAAYSKGRIFVGNQSGTVYALNAKTGKRAWSASQATEFFYATPAVSYGRVFIGSSDGTMYAYGQKSGKLLWAKPLGTLHLLLGGACTTARSTPAPTTASSTPSTPPPATSGGSADMPSAVHAAPVVMNGPGVRRHLRHLRRRPPRARSRPAWTAPPRSTRSTARRCGSPAPASTPARSSPTRTAPT